MLNLKMTKSEPVYEIGHGDLYVGEQYVYPYFYESAHKKMMKDMGKDTIDFKTWGGEYFQFTLGEYHNRPALFLTSTLGDTCVFKCRCLSIPKMKEWAEARSKKKIAIEGAITGYSTFGKSVLRALNTLEQHMAEQEIYFSDEVLEQIYQELSRRAE